MNGRVTGDEGVHGTRAGAGTPGPLDQLRERHRRLRELIRAYRAAAGEGPRQALATEILDALDAHNKLEREVLYPALRLHAGPDVERHLAPRVEEHREADALVRQLFGDAGGRSASGVPDPAGFERLLDHLERHMEAEERELFPYAAERIEQRLPAVGLELARGMAEFTYDYDDVVEATFPASDPPATMAAPRVAVPPVYRDREGGAPRDRAPGA